MDFSRIIRVFPRRTKATPDDALVFTKAPTKENMKALAFTAIDEVHVSVTFSYDLPKAEELYKKWSVVGVPVRMGGPATGQPGGEFTPGMYLKKGYTITSRGCTNKCWFCKASEREGGFRELEIKDGWNVLDDNILLSSPEHFKAVIDMLKRQPERPTFTGGLEARRLTQWHVDLLRSIKAKRIYCSYDVPDDYEPLLNAGRLLLDAGFTVASHSLRCYVLIGYPGDAFDKAEARLFDTIRAGFFPYAMLWKSETGDTDTEWGKFQREWVRPQMVGSKVKEIWKEAVI